MRALVLAGLAMLVACGGDRQGVEVTETDDAPFAGPSRPSLAFDTVYADSGLFVDPGLHPDSLRADSLRRDSLRQDSLRSAEVARPDFRAFWPTFQAAVRRDRAVVAALAAFSDGFTRADFEATLYEAAFSDGLFREGVLGLTARDFRRAGTRRQASVVVGYDADGQVVPQDEAITESVVVLTFDAVDGTYRLVDVELAG